jgi:hypothetical protein
MKNRILVVSLAIASIFLVSACQNKKTDAGKVAATSTQSNDSGKIKDEIVRIVSSLPNNTETVNLINSTGAAYLAGFTAEDLKPETLMTRSDKARVYGSVIFDLAYTNTYRQVESFSKLMKVFETLTQDLGFQELVQKQKEFRAHYQQDKTNPDSLDVMLSNMLKETNTLIQSSGSAADISLVFSGTVAKSLHVISYLTLFAPAKDKLLVVLQKQKGMVNAVCEILAKSPEDASVSKMYQSMIPIQKIFNAPEPFTPQTVEEINKLTAFITQ